jgi:hypothetical protein
MAAARKAVALDTAARPATGRMKSIAACSPTMPPLRGSGAALSHFKDALKASGVHTERQLDMVRYRSVALSPGISTRRLFTGQLRGLPLPLAAGSR